MEDDAAPDAEVSIALEAYVRRFEGLLRYAQQRHGLAREDLDELIQEVRLRLWRTHAGPSGLSAVTSSYVYRTAMSAAVDLLRRRRRHEARAVSLSQVGAGTNPAAFATALPDAADAAELSRMLEDALATLPKARAVAVRLHLAGYPREEIAGLMGWTEPKARNLIYRGLSDLRLRLAELGVGPEGVQ